MISANTVAGVSISGAANVLLGNTIGSPGGQGNGTGVIVDAAANTIGGTAVGAGNVIGGNTAADVSISAPGRWAMSCSETSSNPAASV